MTNFLRTSVPEAGAAGPELLRSVPKLLKDLFYAVGLKIDTILLKGRTLGSSRLKTRPERRKLIRIKCQRVRM